MYKGCVAPLPKTKVWPNHQYCQCCWALWWVGFERIDISCKYVAVQETLGKPTIVQRRWVSSPFRRHLRARVRSTISNQLQLHLYVGFPVFTVSLITISIYQIAASAMTATMMPPEMLANLSVCLFAFLSCTNGQAQV